MVIPEPFVVRDPVPHRTMPSILVRKDLRVKFEVGRVVLNPRVRSFFRCSSSRVERGLAIDEDKPKGDYTDTVPEARRNKAPEQRKLHVMQ